ncbi:MAG: hypothetical protein ABI585_14900 [Betaproteobacteria bacterium]
MERDASQNATTTTTARGNPTTITSRHEMGLMSMRRISGRPSC